MADAEQDSLLATVEEGRRQFLALVGDIRPELHRYCARMTGSIADGEDIVQDTLARAYYQLPELKPLPPLRPWLFRIAHNRAIDYLRSNAYRAYESLDDALDIADDEAREPEQTLAREQALRTAISSFLILPPAQRACVVLKDVLEHSNEEIAGQLEITVAAVKSALHRGRERLRGLQELQQQPGSAQVSPALARYATLFNQRDWDGVRSMLADEVRLDLLSRRKLAGRSEVELYYTNYDRVYGWQAVPAWLDGREVLAMMVDGQGDSPAYFVELNWVGSKLTLIRDYRYVPYIATEARFALAPADSPQH
jgi:RNA polymerase sigma-70 factor (ECF subfamily)